MPYKPKIKGLDYYENDHNVLKNLLLDVHLQYPLSAGTRTAGQNLILNSGLGSEKMPALTTGNWTLGTGWAYQTSPNRISKTADGTGTATTTATSNIVAGTVNQITITVDSISGGTVSVSLGGFTGYTIYTTGTFTFYITTLTTGKIIFTPSVTGVRIAISSVSVKQMSNGDFDAYRLTRFFGQITRPLIVTSTDLGPGVIFNAYNNNTADDLFSFRRNWSQYFGADQYGGIKMGQPNSTGQLYVDPAIWNAAVGNFQALSRFTNSNTGTSAGHQVIISTLGGGNVSLLLAASSQDRLYGVDLSDGLNSLKWATQNSFNSPNDGMWFKADAYTANGMRLTVGNNPGDKAITASNGDIESWAESSTIGSNILTNGTFTGNANGWSLTGGFAYNSNKVRYTHSGGTGTLTQAYSSFVIPAKKNHWYKLKYTLSTVSGSFSITIPGFTVVPLQARKYRATATTHTFYIKAIGATTDFQISVTSTSGAFDIDDISLEEVQDGNLIGNGGLVIRDGDNATLGTATLVSGTVTVNTNKVTANSKIFIQRKTVGGTIGNLTYTVVAGASFTVNSDNALDTSVIDWFIVEPI